MVSLLLFETESPYVTLASFELRDLPASASQMLKLKL